MSVLEITALDAGYGGVAVVRNLSVSVDAGEVVAILGPNGAGKTTTLLTISGLLAPIAGSLRVDGTELRTRRRAHAWRVARAGVAHVPEDRGLFYALTVKENLLLGARSRALRGTVVSQAVERFPALSRLLDRPSGLLSGGEQQMLAIARALGSRPRLLLIDEMSLGLAPIIVEALLPDVARIAHDERIAVVLVEQHVGAALAIADRALVLVHGAVALEGSASELRRSPN